MRVVVFLILIFHDRAEHRLVVHIVTEYNEVVVGSDFAVAVVGKKCSGCIVCPV